MAAIKGFVGAALLVKVAHPDTPTNFVHYCSINAERGIDFTANMIEDFEEDCDDATLIAWLTREVESLSVAVSGGGKINTPDTLFFFDWWKSGLGYPCQIVMDVPAADGGLIFAGDFKVASWGISAASRRAKGTGQVSLVSDGEVTAEPNT